MKKILTITMLLCCFIVYGQDTKPKESTFEFYGFIRYEAYFDTYKGLNAANEQFFVVPNFAGVDANGKHINETPTYNFSSMATRVGVRVAGPEIFKAKTTANIEADFAGDLASNPALFRVRQANAVFTWEKSSLLVGQTWHPFWSGKVYPTVGGLNTGAPFQPFNRSPQIRFDYKVLPSLTLSAALVSEFQYKSYGFSKIDSMTVKAMTIDKSECYNRNAALPEIVGNIEFNKKGFTLGSGISLKEIRPTLYTVGISPGKDDKKYVSDDVVKSISFVGYSQYVKNKFTVRAKAVLGQNMTHLTIPGGYGVKSVETATGAMSYTPYNTLTSFLNAIYGKTYQVGIFAGYLKNLGTSEALYNFGQTDSPVAVTPGLVPNIESMYRIAPSFTINVSKLKLVFEYELTNAQYGTGKMDLADGLYDDTVNAVNNRGLIMMMYSF